MFAQVIEGGTTPDRRTEMDRIVVDELVPRSTTSRGSPGRSTSSIARPGKRS